MGQKIRHPTADDLFRGSLNYLGYYGGEIDGIWGLESKAATVRFQQDNSLDADGVFGTQTIARSVEPIRAIQKAVTDGKIAIDANYVHMDIS